MLCGHAGFSINGTAKKEELLRKGGAKPGQAIVLTKALGTGVLMAASMRGKAKGRWVTGKRRLLSVSKPKKFNPGCFNWTLLQP